ncbi:MAG: thrombospondin, partial [Nitrosopumilus sp.]|nr:thrombospondin [Nitrosopumilus sp.]
DSVIDIRSPAIVSNFEHIPNIGLITFSIDSPQYVIVYIPVELISEKMLVTVNGNIPRELTTSNNVLGEKITMVRFVPQNAGVVMIMPFE